jgi:uncharacterized OB-fold protein
MTIYKCTACGKQYVTAPAICGCGGEQFQEQTSPGRGQVYSCTTLHVAAEAFEEDVPFQIAIVELEGGPRLTGRILGERVDIGDEVRLVEEWGGVHFFTAVTQRTQRTP